MVEPIDWGFSWAVVVTGLVVVFVVLILLVILCMVMGNIFASIDKKKEQKLADEQSQAAAATSKPQAPKANVVPAVSAATDEGDIAAISAAISVIMGESNTPFAIRSIKKAKDQRSAWNSAGITDNTRQF